MNHTQQQPRPPAPACALCKAPATRVLPMLVQLMTSQVNPVLISGRTAPKPRDINLQLPICDACQIDGARLGISEPIPFEAPPLVQTATASDVNRIVGGAR